MLLRLLLPLSVIIAALTTSPGPAHAGIVNVQSLLAKEADKGFSGAFKGTADWRTGNVNLLLLSASPIVRYRKGDHLVLGVLRGAFGKSGDKRIISRTFEHLRYRYHLRDRVLLESFVQHEFDEFKRLQLRALLGIGTKIDLAQGKRYGVSFGLAYMLERERLRDDDQPDAGAEDTAHRASSYLTGRYELDDRVQFIDTFYIQPRLTDVNDTRMLNEAQIVMKLSKSVSLTTSFTIAYDSRTPDDVEELDSALKSIVTVAF